MTLNELLDLRANGVPTTPMHLRSVLVNLLTKELNRYYHYGIPHPNGTTAFLAETIDTLTGWPGFGVEFLAAMDATCPVCDQPSHAYSCAICTLRLCPACQLTHDAARSLRGAGSLCSQIAGYAETHARFRSETSEPVIPEAEDFYVARKMMASTIMHLGSDAARR